MTRWQTAVHHTSTIDWFFLHKQNRRNLEWLYIMRQTIERPFIIMVRALQNVTRIRILHPQKIMELLFSLVIIHGQMFRLFFFFLFFCFLHFFLFMAPCNTLHSNFMDLNELQPVSCKHDSLFQVFSPWKLSFGIWLVQNGSCFIIKELIIVKMDSSNLWKKHIR